ncbi:hypothetical protein [Flagellimonas sp. S3867]|uniref:hypothetical protein n=1 Tax=Flagellimonas sp. S3867 TaxID=2768063 RepID=UPI0016855391|nr:hypothetical protein [Flagellimonas sp. S3867]
MKNSIIIYFLLLFSFSSLKAQTLDEIAYNHYWERLEKFIGKTGSKEKLHLLSVYREASWADSDNQAALSDLYEFASMIPEEEFVIEPGFHNLRLHEQYGRLISYVEIPEGQTAEEKQLFVEAQKKLEKSTEEYFEALDEYNSKFYQFWEFLDSKKIKMDNFQRRHFRRMYRRILNNANRKYKDAHAEVLKYSDRFKTYRDALVAFDEFIESASTAAADVQEGANLYNGGINVLSQIQKCTDANDDGWSAITFRKNITSSYTKNGNWNVNGSWGGSTFFGGLVSGGGGRTTYEHYISEDTDSISIRFCNLRFVPVRPTQWYNASLLEGIKDGTVTLREGNPLEDKPLYGPNGYFPRLLKGIVVASDVDIISSINNTKSSEIRKKTRGKAGFGIGKLRIGGKAGSSKESKWTSNTSGSFKSSTSSESPIIIGVLTEDTSM